MRILKHGQCLKFYCDGCGCEWLANKDECKKQTHDSTMLPTDWGYACPDCGKWISTRQEARGVKE